MSRAVLDALWRWTEEVEACDLLDEPHRLRERIEALDRLDIFDLDASAAPSRSAAEAVFKRARKLSARLEAANVRLYEAIRQDIRRGRGRESLLRWFFKPVVNGTEYDWTDELMAGVLRFDEIGEPMIELTSEMVFYQPTPARHIFDLIERSGITERDVLVDLGSGLGHVTLAASICTRAHCIGIDLEPAYIACARRCAEALCLPNAKFLQQDARVADLSEGTVFYLYTPFEGGVLRAVLDRLGREGLRRPIRVCTLGSCVEVVTRESWLDSVGVPDAGRVSIFRSRC